MTDATSSRTIARRAQRTKTRAHQSTVASPTEYLFISMETDYFTFNWKTWRRNPEVKFGISLNFDESNNKVEVASVADRSLAGEKNRRLSEIPAACSYILLPGDIIEAVNTQTEIEEIQRELQTALSIHMKVARMKEFPRLIRSRGRCGDESPDEYLHLKQ